MAKGATKDFDDPAWKYFPPTIIIHGSEDPLVPLEASEKVVSVIGRSPLPKNFRTRDHGSFLLLTPP